MRYWGILLTAGWLGSMPSLGLAQAPKDFDSQVTGGKLDQRDVIVRVPVADPVGGFAGSVRVSADGQSVPAQLLDAETGAVVVARLPELKAGQTVKLAVRFDNQPANVKSPFRWVDMPGQSTELFFGDVLRLRYLYAFDDSTPEARNRTFKPYTHLFDVSTGKVQLTNGPEGKYPHHRGIFFGFNRISYGKQQADVWHGNKGESQRHERTLTTEAGPVAARQRVQIGWYGQDQKRFATEIRETTVYDVPGGHLLDMVCRVTTDLPLVKLDGDPQHAGLHFRAAQEVERSTEKQTVFIRPDGVGKPNETRNWDPKTKQGPVDLPWVGMAVSIAGKRYTILRIDHPDNPTPRRHSERAYGRFGNYFEYELTPQRPLVVRVRFWVQEGDMTVAQCQSLAEAFR
jgi:hypothetical protein